MLARSQASDLFEGVAFDQHGLASFGGQDVAPVGRGNAKSWSCGSFQLKAGLRFLKTTVFGGTYLKILILWGRFLRAPLFWQRIPMADSARLLV